MIQKSVRSATLRLALVSAILCGAAVARAQLGAGLSGRVIDPSGARIANALVTLTQPASNIVQSAATTSVGDYRFSGLSPGVYTLRAAAPGFRPVERTAVALPQGETIRIDLTLVVGAADQTLSVGADPPMLQAGTSNIQTNIAGGAVVALPLNSRNFIQLSTLAPGVGLPPGTVLPRINGGRPRTNEYLYDGISALQPEPGQVVFFPIVDSIAEFTVEANNVPAEFGRLNGGVVNVATRSGSNLLHGSVFEFFRNESVNARNYFAAPSPARKPEYRRNLYGATLGGPLLPNRLFFFADYQGVKTLVGRTVISTVPTRNQRLGIFTGVAHIFDPTSTSVVRGATARTEFPGDVISSSFFDPAAQALLARFPNPTTTESANNFSRTAADADHQNQFDIRFDGAGRTRGGLGATDRTFLRYSFFSDVEQPVTPLPEGSGAIAGAVIGTGGVSGLTHVLGQQAVVGETHTVTPHLLTLARIGYTRRGNTTAGTTLGNTASAALGIPGIPNNAAFNNALPLFTLTGFQQLGPSASTFTQYQTAVWQVVGAVFWSRGTHAFKVGGDLRWYQLNTVSPPNPTGSFAFTTTGTNQPGFAATDKLPNGNALASFLLGQVDTFQIDLQTAKLRPRDHIQEYFLQDDWRATTRLTLNLGARWTLHFPSTEKSNQGAVFNLATQQLDFLGRNGYPRSAREIHWANVAPRLGLALLATPTTVVRAGFGIVFIDQSGITTPFTTPQFPFIQSVTQKTADSVNAAFTLSAGPSVSSIPLTPDAGLGQSVYTAHRSAGSGYAEQWNLAVQHAVTRSLSLEIAYVGSHIVHVGVPDANLNQLSAAQLAQGASLLTAVPNPYFGALPVSSSIGGRTIPQAQLLKPYPRFQNVAAYRNNSGTTNYNALEASIERRFTAGLNLLAAYTHSRLIDDASSVFSSTVLSSPNSNSLIAADAFRPYLERDASNGDMPNITSVAALYQLPFGRDHRLGSGRLGNTLLAGWTINAIALLQSGMPVTVVQATNNNAFAGFSLQRPNRLAPSALPPAQRTPARFFNTAAFAAAPQFTLGNASRNPVRGPAYRDLDLALVKHTRLSDRSDVEFRAELFDLTNTPAFSQPNGSFGAPAFGSITSTTTDPRVVQFALRLSR
ncbi:MAG: carboxypeptidase-like regulatory domain-containing protein [Acidobacteriota bacterium]|nr:carboxypeptidase-like regulatory domain-containing protein [Acidobacteriota bacterium]